VEKLMDDLHQLKVRSIDQSDNKMVSRFVDFH